MYLLQSQDMQSRGSHRKHSATMQTKQLLHTEAAWLQGDTAKERTVSV